MSNEALPARSRQLLRDYLRNCRNLGLILDKYAPWGLDSRGNWDLVMLNMVRRQREETLQPLSGGEAKGLWLNKRRRANSQKGESPSLFEVSRTDTELMVAVQQRWQAIVKDGKGIAFTMTTSERLVAGVGASHVLETALTLDRNTGLPYLPGSSVKGLARAWGLIEVAAQLNVSLEDQVVQRGMKEPASLLNVIATLLIEEPDETLMQSLRNLVTVAGEAEVYIEWFRFIFGSQGNAGAICFVDAVYHGEREPNYATDVMTPHYVQYYTESGGKPPAEDDNPNPISFITVDAGNVFAFGLMPRLSAFSVFSADEREANMATALNTAADWLGKALSQMGAGAKTAAGYGFFSRKSQTLLIGT